MFWNNGNRRKYEEIQLGALKAVESWLKAHDKEIAALQSERKQATLTGNVSGLVECETCGCLLKKSTAIKGKDELKYRPIDTYPFVPSLMAPWPQEAYIYTPYYCKVHVSRDNV